MKRIKIPESELIIPFVTPPENQGQMIEISYSCTEDYVLRRVIDRSDAAQLIGAYKHVDDGDFAPHFAAPDLGNFVGLVDIVEGDEK